MTDPTPFEHPERIGPYEIVQVLGEGGMGVVYEAEQHEPVQRRVALKMMKVGMDTREVVGRFDAERQALAVMDHPGIATVFDAGATEQGRPYFVMELVKGEPLTRYCDARRLTLRERVELFVDVCMGVQHAHQRGIIHRDLKPSNILVTEVDGRPVPKVIDFGIAKATEASDDAGLTQAGHMLGTPAYMSPEQAEGGGADLDVRADVYALGIVLYELLAGDLPFTPEELSVGGFKFLAILLTKDHPRPSARLASIHDTQETIAELRRTRPETLRRILGGELDWVIMKAIEKDRERRYPDVGDLIRELQAFLSDEPVEARPPSAAYRASKFVRRNRAWVAAGVVALLALVGGTVAATVGLLRARAEAQASAEVTDFLTGLFEVSDPSEARGNSITAREILDAGAERIETELAGQPALQARMMYTIGEVYRNLALVREAEPLLTRAVEIRESEFGPNSPEVAEALIPLGQVRNAQNSQAGNPDVERAIEIYERALGPDAVEVSNGLLALSLYQGDSVFETGARRALEIRSRHLDADDPDLAEAFLALGIALDFTDRNDTAAVLYRRALEIYEAADDPGQLSTLQNLAIIALESGDLDRAMTLYDSAEVVANRFHGDRSTQTAQLLANRAVAQFNAGDIEGAEVSQREAIRRLVDGFGPDASNLDWYYWNLDFMLRAQGKWPEIDEHAEVLAQYLERMGSSKPVVAIARLRRAAALLMLGSTDGALSVLDDVLPVLDTTSSGDRAFSQYVAALAYEARGDRADADEQFRRAIVSLDSTQVPYILSVRQDLQFIEADSVRIEIEQAYADFRARR